MKSLDEFNIERSMRLKSATEPHANGIACPECGLELWDSNPMCVLTTNPPSKGVHCPACGFTGSRVA